MKCVLKTKDGVMIKSIDNANTKLELTTDIKEAYNYVNGEWYAKSELEYLQFHFKKDYPEVLDMHCEWVNENNSNTLGDGTAMGATPIWGDPMEDAVEQAEAPMTLGNLHDAGVYTVETTNEYPIETEAATNLAETIGTFATGPTHF